MKKASPRRTGAKPDNLKNTKVKIMDELDIRTSTIHAGGIDLAKKLNESVSVPKVLPVYMTSVFSFDDVPALDRAYEQPDGNYVYSRMSNPNHSAAEETLAAAEKAEAAAVFASGMAAITTTLLACVKSGDHIVASSVLYGGVYDFLANELPRFGVSVTFADTTDADAVRAALRENTVIVYAETICNPLMEVADIPQLARIAHEHGCRLLIDNTFAPAVARPLSLGADIVLYSTTKYLGGHSDIMGGAAVADAETIARLKHHAALYGGIMSPFDAWLLCRSLRTLDMRVVQHSRNALAVAQFLHDHPKIERVYYPGLADSPYKAIADRQFLGGRYGGMLSADIANGEKGASDFIRACPTIKLVPSLAGVATTVSYPVKTSHRSYSAEALHEAGISAGQLRFSIGLENIDDILSELDEALRQV